MHGFFRFVQAGILVSGLALAQTQGGATGSGNAPMSGSSTGTSASSPATGTSSGSSGPMSGSSTGTSASSPATGTSSGSSGYSTDTGDRDRGRDHNFGWIGLIGLAGLSGLLRRDNRRDDNMR